MEDVFRKLGIVNRGLRYKLMLAFSLMSIIPILACFYLISMYILPKLDSITDVSAVVLCAIFIAVLGLFLARKIVSPVIDMAIEAKIIASGEYDRKIAVGSDDEVGHLGIAINMMTHKIKTNLDELKNYGQRMREINVEVHKKVLALSSLLQIGNIISTGSQQLDALLALAVEKAAMVFDNGFGILFLSKDGYGDFVPKISYNVVNQKLEKMVIKRDSPDLAGKIMRERSILVVDSASRLAKEASSFLQSLELKNIIMMPIFSGRLNLGLLMIGSGSGNFIFNSEDVDMIKIFSKQITIAIENDMLNKRTEELSIKDELTDLYNKNFIMTRLEEEIKRAVFYQRPCSFILFNVDNFKAFRDSRGELVAEESIKKMAKVIKENSTPVGKVARMSGDEFAMLLPEKNKREAIQIAEDVRRKIESTNLLKEGKATLTVSGGVSENPIDGASRDELFKAASDNLKKAKAAGKNNVV